MCPLPWCHAVGHPPASGERRSMAAELVPLFIPFTGSSLPASVLLAGPALVLLGIQRTLHGTAGKGGKRRNMGPVPRKTALLRASLRKILERERTQKSTEDV